MIIQLKENQIMMEERLKFGLWMLPNKESVHTGNIE